MSISLPTPSPSNFPVNRDGNNQEYVETCDGWVRATLAMSDGHPHIRVQEHHDKDSSRLHLGPLIPLTHWFAFKESVDRLVGPYIREPLAPLTRRTQSGALEYAILEVIATVTERRRQNGMGGWAALVRDRVPEPLDNRDLEFAFKRLTNSGRLNLTKDGQRYSGNASDDHWFFWRGYFDAEITPDGWAYWESLKG